jgi:hypothetical protein
LALKPVLPLGALLPRPDIVSKYTRIENGSSLCELVDVLWRRAKHGRDVTWHDAMTP